MRTRGKFIVIDGGDGTGKTSVIEFLKSRLENTAVLFTREPGGTPVAEAIRDILLKERSEYMFPETELMLFSAARLQHVGNFILPNLKKGLHVISDRFSASTIAYQLYGNGRFDLSIFFETLNKAALNGCAPDLYVLLDVNTETALTRRKKAGGLTRFDRKYTEFHKAVRDGFLKQIANFPHGIIIDAGKSKEEVGRGVLNEVKICLNM